MAASSIRSLAAAFFLIVAGADALAQAQPASAPKRIYRCPDGKGGWLTADHPIPACAAYDAKMRQGAAKAASKPK